MLTTESTLKGVVKVLILIFNEDDEDEVQLIVENPDKCFKKKNQITEILSL